jgi:hypothetical protein
MCIHLDLRLLVADVGSSFSAALVAASSPSRELLRVGVDAWRLSLARITRRSVFAAATYEDRKNCGRGAALQ